MRDKKVERVLALYEQFIRGKFVYKNEEAKRHGVDEKTIKRDFNDLRGYFSNGVFNGKKTARILYDRKKKCYYLKSDNPKPLQKTDILIIIKVLLASKGLIKEEMLPLIDKLLDCCMDEEDRKMIKDLIANEKLYYKGPVHGNKLLERIEIISKAKQQQRRIEFDYKRLDDEIVHRVAEPVGMMFSEYYFYMDAGIVWTHNGEQYSDTMRYRIDRIQGDIKVLEEHFSVPYNQKFNESRVRESSPFLIGGDEKRLKFWCNSIALEAVLDRIPSAEIIVKEEGRYLLLARVCGDGAEMWLRGQGEHVELL